MTIPRDLLAQAFPNQPRMIAEFENLTDLADGTAEQVGLAVAATNEASQASYVTLSANASLPNEFVLTAGNGVTVAVEEGVVRISTRVRANGVIQFQTLAANSIVLIPPTGRLATTGNEETLSSKTLAAPRWTGPVYADNTAALAGGLVAGDTYRTGLGVLMVVY